MWLNYHHLLYFKTIAEEQSVSKAAEKLRLGQPTLSAQLKQFEEILGVHLFERKHKRLILTDQGRIALQYAQKIFRLGDEMVDALNDRAQPTRIRIQIGALDGISKNRLAAISKICIEKFDCQIVWIEGALPSLMEDLYQHKIDLIVTNYLPKANEARTFHHRLVHSEPVHVLGSSKFKDLKENFPLSLQGQRFIMPTYESKLREDFEHWLRVNELSVDVAVESQDTALKSQLARDGVGLTVGVLSDISSSDANDIAPIGALDEVQESIYFIASERKVVNPPSQFLFQKFSFV